MRLELSGRQTARVDPEDDWATAHRWYLTSGTPATWQNGRNVYLRRLIMDAQPGQRVTHLDGNALNCTRANLRFASRTEIVRAQKKRTDNTSNFRGVSRKCGRWVAQITIDGRPRHIGYFNTPADAARAYDAAARKHFGPLAKTNFKNKETTT